MATFTPLINSFAAPTTGGYTTPSIQSTTGAGVLGADQNQPTTTINSQTTIPLGNIAKQPTPSQPVLTIPSSQTAGTNGGGVNIDYTLHNGESIQDYNARIASARSATTSPATPTNTSGGSQGLGTGGGAAPAGMSYNAQGQLVPTSSLPTNQPPQTFNTNPYNASAPTYGGAVGALAGTASQPSAAFTQAQQQAQQALTDLQTSRTNEANALSLNAQNPIPLEFQQGRGNILQNQYLQQQNAYAQTYAGATAQEQAATSQQGTQQQGLGAAAGLTAPQPANAFGTFNPVTGQYGSYGGGAAGGIGTAGQTLGNLGLSQSYYQNLVPAYNQAQSVNTNLNSFLQQNPDINPYTLNQANFANQWLNNQFSSPKYQQLGQYINELLQTLTPIVGSQGLSDYKSQLVQSMVNPTSNAASIQQQIQNLLGIAQGKMNATYQSFNAPAGGGGINTGGSAQPGIQSGSNFYATNWFGGQ